MQALGRDTIVDGRYRVLNRLGSGGMADVFCALDQQLGRKVALKVLHQRFADDHEFVERFRREASSAAGLQHPNVVGIYDRGEWDGTSYIAMEFVDGRTLKELVRERGPLPPATAVAVAIQVLKALRFAHRRGIVHRDVKPHNVLVDEEGRVKVADFGIARAGASDMTETGSIMGTAQYLSPEQAQGHPVDARSDLYSVGILLYELLTGEVPFDGDAAVTVALKQVSQAPVPPSHRRPGIPGALDAVVMRAMAKSPDERYQDADAFIAALEAVDAPGGAPPKASAPMAPARRGPRRWLVPLLIVLALAAVGAGAWLLTRGEEVRVPDVVGREAEDASRTVQRRGLEVELRTRSSARVDRGDVISQDPEGGSRVEEGSTVTLTVSGGPPLEEVPDVAGLEVEPAEAQLREAGFRTRTREESSDEVPDGQVIRTAPGAREEERRGRTITLIVSSGPAAVPVPDVRGRPQSQAVPALEQLGFAVQVQGRETPESDPGLVIEQSPRGSAPPGSTITLTVAQSPPDVEVPDVVGLEENDARSELEDAGFEVRDRERAVQSEEEDGFVVDQNPDPGAEREPGSTVTLVVGRFEEPEPPDEGTPTPEPGA